MPIVGFSFDKISGEKTSVISKGMSVSSDISIKGVEEANLSLNKPCLKISFQFVVDYSKGVGNLTLEGHVLCLESPKKIKEIVSTWKKSKSLPEDLSLGVLNTILKKCNIESLILSEKVGLPPQLPIGRMVPANKPNEKAVAQ